jgi:hypothetical protein
MHNMERAGKKNCQYDCMWTVLAEYDFQTITQSAQPKRFGGSMQRSILPYYKQFEYLVKLLLLSQKHAT